MIVFLIEEPSMSPVVKKLMEELWPSGREGLHWQIITYQGKLDLQKNMARKMTGWNYNDPHFIILRDNDGADCFVLKKKLLDLVAETNKPHHVRLVCQHLEAWFLGDLAAVEAAFPQSKATALQERNPYRTPDEAANAEQLLEDLIGNTGKVGHAESIARHLSLYANRSPSFQAFLRLVDELIPLHSAQADV